MTADLKLNGKTVNNHNRKNGAAKLLHRFLCYKYIIADSYSHLFTLCHIIRKKPKG